MSLLAPLFLVALGALTIPVLIHLTQRERKQIVEFPSLMFLQRIPYPSVRRRRIRNWVLLMVRMAALVLIVLAFTRPFLDRPTVAMAGTLGPREVVILLDHSYSMAYGDRWDRARAAARRAVDGLDNDDRATLILFGTGAELDVRSTPERARLMAAIDAAKLSAQATRYAPGIKLAQRVLTESRLPRREVIMISDFQRNGWIRDESLRLPEGAVFTPVVIADPDPANVTVSTLSLQRSVFSGQGRITVVAGLVNRGPNPVNNLEVRLDVDGRTIETQRATVQPTAPASVSFQPFTLGRAYTRGTVRIARDKLPLDDAFHFVVSPAQRVPVLVVEPNSANPRSSLYLLKALSIGTTPAYQVQVRQGESVSTTDLDRHRVVILNDTAAAASVDALKRFVQAGGGLFIVLGEHAMWSSSAADLLPGIPGAVIDRQTARGGSLAELDYSHPILELFKAPRSGDLSGARFFRYRAVTLKEPAAPQGPPTAAQPQQPPAERVIARFDDGSIAMAERTVGLGRVVLWSSTLDNYWTDFGLRPVFLPFVHQVTRYLATYEEPAQWFTVGNVVDPAHLLQSAGLGVQAGTSSTGGMILTPGGQRVAQTGSAPGPVELGEMGFYEIHGRSGANDRTLSIASNPDTTESDLALLDPQELAAALAGRAGGADGTSETQQLTPDDQERRQNMWWYMLLVGILLLGLETAISNRLPPVADAPTPAHPAP
jgi:hypothetical protein